MAANDGAPTKFSTADLYDVHAARVQSCPMQFRQFGGRDCFFGRIRTVKTYEDNSLVKTMVSQDGKGDVLVVDAGGSLRVALVGDVIAGLAARNGWAGIVLWGCVRDTEALARLNIGIKAIGSNPRPSTKQGLGQVDVELRMGDVVFRPGDWLYSDPDGILVSDAALQ